MIVPKPLIQQTIQTIHDNYEHELSRVLGLSQREASVFNHARSQLLGLQLLFAQYPAEKAQISLSIEYLSVLESEAKLQHQLAALNNEPEDSELVRLAS